MKNAGVWVGIILLIFAGTIFWQALSYDYYNDSTPGPGLFPLWLSGSLIVLSVLYIIDSIRKEVIDLRSILPKHDGLKKVLSIFVSLILFFVLVPFTGYIIASVIMMGTLFFREYKWHWNLGISFVVSIAIFTAFQYLLKVPLPVNAFGF